MKSVYSSPFRVYLIVLAFAFLGIIAGMKLPISLYPNSNKPTIGVEVNYGQMTAVEFADQFGSKVENSLMAINGEGLSVEKVSADYGERSVQFEVEFKWGADPIKAKSEVQVLINALSATWSSEIRDNVNVYNQSNGSGFVAISFYSSKQREINQLYDILDPILTPLITGVEDAENANLWNPNQREVNILLNVKAMTNLGLFPRQIEQAIKAAMVGFKGGSVVVGSQKLSIQMPRTASSLKKLNNLIINTPAGVGIPLRQIALVELGPQLQQSRIFKTSGAKSLILFATPKSGGNVKRMAEDILKIVEEKKHEFPSDVQYRVLVDPSEFIRASVTNVMHEVLIAASLAVLVLFLFIGSLKNTITAAIEIPLSMVLAFILMKLSGMNMNLISLGGLALSAGMNVDASVVVMENIFRHFEERVHLALGPMTFTERVDLIAKAVKEVTLPVVASTIASLVVFIPLAFTSDLTNAILGDLAKAVVYSHGSSGFVALILVPTIRLHLLNRSKGAEVMPRSPIEGFLIKLENWYSSSLKNFLLSPKRFLAPLCIVLSLAASVHWILPRLNKEIIGLPDTDWMMLKVNTSGNTMIRQMDTESARVEEDLLKRYGTKILYTFTQVHSPNDAMIMARLKDKRLMMEIWKAWEAEFQNTPTLTYRVFPWNPAELPIPNPPHLRVVVRGGSLEDRELATRGLLEHLKEKEVFPRLKSDPSVDRKENIFLRPIEERWNKLNEAGIKFTPFDIADIARVATEGRSLGDLPLGEKSYNIFMRFPDDTIKNAEDLESWPIRVGNKFVALRSLTTVDKELAKPRIFREQGRNLFVVEGRQDKKGEHLKESSKARALVEMENFKKEKLPGYHLETTPTFQVEDAEVDLNQALSQLSVAIGLSILLIFLTLLIQFGSIVHTLIVLAAIPTGILGVLLSLFIFQSPLSLNSALGVILLNGIAVANSIILVDFIRQLSNEGMSPMDAIINATKKRLRPILITSLTTILGMMPMALGLGEGGKILQPLGISVAGGLWISTLLTLFVVPLLEHIYLSRKELLLILFVALPLIKSEKVQAEELLNFEKALEEIVARDTQIPSSEAELSAADMDHFTKKMSLFPTISFRQSEIQNSFGQDKTSEKSSIKGELNLFRFGADAAAIESASETLNKKEREKEATKLQVEYEASKVLLQNIESYKLLKLAENFLSLKRESLTSAKLRYEKGLTPIQEVEKVTVEEQNALAQMRDAEINFEEATGELKALLGENKTIHMEWPLSDFFKNGKTKQILARKNWRVEELPDFQAKQFEMRAKELSVAQKKREIFPRLDFVYSYDNARSSFTASDSQFQQTFAITFTVPLFSGFRDYNQYHAANMDYLIAKQQLELSRRVREKDYATAFNNLQRTVDTALGREVNLKLSQKLYSDNFLRFQKGHSSVNELFVDQARLLDSERLQISGWKEAHLGLMKLCRAEGLSLHSCLK